MHSVFLLYDIDVIKVTLSVPNRSIFDGLSMVLSFHAYQMAISAISKSAGKYRYNICFMLKNVKLHVRVCKKKNP